MTDGVNRDKGETETVVRPPTGIWSCKVGETDKALPQGSDLPMRKAIAAAYLEITGEEPRFIFSGWGTELTEAEREVLGGMVS